MQRDHGQQAHATKRFHRTQGFSEGEAERRNKNLSPEGAGDNIGGPSAAPTRAGSILPSSFRSPISVTSSLLSEAFMDDAPPSGTSWRVWAGATIIAALLSGPVIPRVIDHLEERRAEAASLPVSERLLTDADLRGKSSWELDVLRNQIYARHGRRFENRALQSYFESQPWYRGKYSPDRFRDDWLNPVERTNASLIREFQSRAH
jgi:hypothetical protein